MCILYGPFGGHYISLYRLHFLLLFGWGPAHEIEACPSELQTIPYLPHLPQFDLPGNMQVISHRTILYPKAAAFLVVPRELDLATFLFVPVPISTLALRATIPLEHATRTVLHLPRANFLTGQKTPVTHQMKHACHSMCCHALHGHCIRCVLLFWACGLLEPCMCYIGIAFDAF